MKREGKGGADGISFPYDIIPARHRDSTVLSNVP